MKKINKILALALIGASAFAMQSCEKENPHERLYTALVTYETDDNGVRFQLDDTTSLVPTNFHIGFYKERKVRALINFTYDNMSEDTKAAVKPVKVYAIDTIRTKLPVKDMGELNGKTYGNDRLEIIRDWVTIAEDGYLTMRVRTHMGNNITKHYINLVFIGEKDGAYEFELRHNANGDIYGVETDGLIAFDLNSLAPADRSPVKLHLKWSGFTQEKDMNCMLTFRKTN